MNVLKRVMAVTLTWGALMVPVMAQDNGWMPGSFTGNIGFTNDYVFRGVTQTQEGMAVQGGFDWSHDIGLYLGTWASNVKFGAPGEGSTEFDVYGGYKKTFDGMTFEVGGIGYLYPDSASRLNYDYWEAKVGLGYDFGVASVGASLNYSPEFFGKVGKGYYYQGKIVVPLTVMREGLTIDAAIGRQDLESPSVDYTDWNVGVTKAFSWFKLDLRYYDTNVKGCAKICDSRFVVKVSRTF